MVLNHLLCAFFALRAKKAHNNSETETLFETLAATIRKRPAGILIPINDAHQLYAWAYSAEWCNNDFIADLGQLQSYDCSIGWEARHTTV